MHPYSMTVCEHMKAFYDSLSEKDRRRYAAVEAEKLGHGGIEYIAKVFGCDERVRSVQSCRLHGDFRRFFAKSLGSSELGLIMRTEHGVADG